MALLLSYQNQDGGFGEFAGYDSNVLDTALALEAFAIAGEAGQSSLQGAVGFLIQNQSPDGAWRDTLNPDSADTSLFLTAIVLRSLAFYGGIYAISGSITAGQGFLLDTRGSNDLWSEHFLSALSLIGLISTSSDISPLASSVTALRQAQQTNGSWEDGICFERVSGKEI